MKIDDLREAAIDMIQQTEDAALIDLICRILKADKAKRAESTARFDNSDNQ